MQHMNFKKIWTHTDKVLIQQRDSSMIHINVEEKKPTKKYRTK